jgi:hypothetical protein
MQDWELRDYQYNKLKEMRELRYAVENSTRNAQDDIEYYRKKSEEYWALYKKESDEFLAYMDKVIKEHDNENNSLLCEALEYAANEIHVFKENNTDAYESISEKSGLIRHEELLNSIFPWAKHLMHLQSEENYSEYFELQNADPREEFGADNQELLDLLECCYNFIILSRCISDYAYYYEKKFAQGEDDEDLKTALNYCVKGVAYILKAIIFLTVSIED